jgi:uncharacterized protein DUF998
MTGLHPVAPPDCRRLWYAVVASGVFLLIALIGGALRPDYDAWHQSISALSLGPAGWVQDLSFLLLGSALFGTTPVWRRVLAGGVGAGAYPVLTALTGLSLIVTAFVPQDPAPGYDPERLGYALPTTIGLIHLAAAGVGAAASCAALFVMASRFATLPDWRAWVAPSRLAALLTISSVIIYAVWSLQPTGLAGTFERLVVVIPGIWGWALVRRLSAGAPFVASREGGSG